MVSIDGCGREHMHVVKDWIQSVTVYLQSDLHSSSKKSKKKKKKMYMTL